MNVSYRCCVVLLSGLPTLREAGMLTLQSSEGDLSVCVCVTVVCDVFAQCCN